MLSIAKKEIMKKVFDTSKDKIKNNLELITIILNILLLYFNPYLWLIIITNIAVLGLSKNHTFELSFKIRKKEYKEEKDSDKIEQICAGEFSEIEGKLYDENGNLVDQESLRKKYE
jgi:hypothetical protein